MLTMLCLLFSNDSFLVPCCCLIHPYPCCILGRKIKKHCMDTLGFRMRSNGPKRDTMLPSFAGYRSQYHGSLSCGCAGAGSSRGHDFSSSHLAASSHPYPLSLVCTYFSTDDKIIENTSTTPLPTSDPRQVLARSGGTPGIVQIVRPSMLYSRLKLLDEPAVRVMLPRENCGLATSEHLVAPTSMTYSMTTL